MDGMKSPCHNALNFPQHRNKRSCPTVTDTGLQVFAHALEDCLKQYLLGGTRALPLPARLSSAICGLPAPSLAPPPAKLCFPAVVKKLLLLLQRLLLLLGLPQPFWFLGVTKS